MQVIAMTERRAAPAGQARATAAGALGSSRTARSPAKSVATTATTIMVSL